MTEFCKLTFDDELKYKKIIDMGVELFGFDKKDVYKCIIDNDEYVVFVCGPMISMFSYGNDGKIKVSTFVVNDEYKVQTFTDNDFQIDILEDAVLVRSEEGDLYSLAFKKNNDNPDFEVSNQGVVYYMHYDKHKDKRVVLQYEHSAYQDNKRIYSYHLNNPYCITVETEVSKRDKGLKFLGWKKSFYRLDFNYYINSLTYSLATMKDFGVMAVIANRALSLQGDYQISKYYQSFLRLSDYVTVTGFPFTKQYSRDEMFEMLEDLGLDKTVLERILTIYNNKEQMVLLRQEVADAFKKSEFAKDNEDYLKLVYKK